MNVGSPEKYQVIDTFPLSASALQAELGGDADLFELHGTAGSTYTIAVVRLDGTTVTFTDRPSGYKWTGRFRSIVSCTCPEVAIARAAFVPGRK